MNRLLGWLLAIIALAIIVFAVMNYGNYSSMYFDEQDVTSASDTEISDISPMGEDAPSEDTSLSTDDTTATTSTDIIQ